MADALRCARFELRRMLVPGRVLAVLLLIAASIQLSYFTLENTASLMQSELPGASAQDVFYAMLNNEWVVGFMLPMAVAVLGADIVSRDTANGMRSTLLLRLRHRGAWWAGKVLAVLLASVAVLLACLVISTAYDALVNGMPVSLGKVSTWMAYTGRIEDIPANNVQIMRPLPASWNILVFDGVIVVAYSVLYAGAVLLLAVALCAVRNRWMPLGIVGFLSAATVMSGNVMDVLTMYGQMSYNIRGMPLYRLLLVTYPFGGSFWRDKIVMAESEPGSFMPMNSFFSAVVMVVGVFVAAVLLGMWRGRKSWSKVKEGGTR